MNTCDWSYSSSQTHWLNEFAQICTTQDDANAKSTKEAEKDEDIFIATYKVKVSSIICVITARTHAKSLVTTIAVCSGQPGI